MCHHNSNAIPYTAILHTHPTTTCHHIWCAPQVVAPLAQPKLPPLCHATTDGIMPRNQHRARLSRCWLTGGCHHWWCHHTCHRRWCCHQWWCPAGHTGFFCRAAAGGGRVSKDICQFATTFNFCKLGVMPPDAPPDLTCHHQQCHKLFCHQTFLLH